MTHLYHSATSWGCEVLAGWREALDPDICAERPDALRENLVDGIALTEQGAADVDPASKAEARQAAAAVASMRTAYQATQATGLVPA